MPRSVRQPKSSLQSYELTRLALASNLRKEIGALLDQWLEENAAAMLGRWLMEQRERSVKYAEALHGDDLRRPGTPSVSDNFLADPAVPRRKTAAQCEAMPVWHGCIAAFPPFSPGDQAAAVKRGQRRRAVSLRKRRASPRIPAASGLSPASPQYCGQRTGAQSQWGASVGGS